MERARENEVGWLRVYINIPIVTRIITTASLLTTLAVHFDFCSPYDLYLNPALIVKRHQYWRLLSSFLFAGPISFHTVFSLIFMYRYSRILEESSFSRASDYCVMVFFLTFGILVVSLTFTKLIFLNNAFTYAVLYIWCRRNPMTRVMVLGILTFHAHYVPFVLLALSGLTGMPLSSDLVSIGVGHCYFFLEDVFPHQRGGFRILKTPDFLRAFLEAEASQEAHAPEENIEGERGERDANNNNLIDGRLAPDMGPLLEENGLG